MLQPYFDFAGTEDIFCYIHPRRCCSTAAIVFFFYNRLGFLLLPEMPFATTGVFATTRVFMETSRVFAITLCFCWNHPKILLPPYFDFAGTGIFHFGVGDEGGWCFGSPAAARLRAPATSRGSGGPSERSACQSAGSRERRWRLLFVSPLFSHGEDDDRRCGADLTVTHVQIEWLWLDRPKRSAGAPAQSTALSVLQYKLHAGVF